MALKNTRPTIRAGLLALWLIAMGMAPADVPATLAFRAYWLVREDVFVPLRWMAGALSAAPTASNPNSNSATVERAIALRREAERLEHELVGKYAASAYFDPALGRAQAEAEAAALALEPAANRVLSRQIEEELGTEGLSLIGGRSLPPVNFRFTPLPNLLVVSARERIARELSITLRGDLTLNEVEHIEEAVARLGYSTLIVPIGGLGTYPSMIPRSSDLPHSLRTIAHEWVHHYLTLRPLGWRYALRIEKDGAVITMNETAAGIIGDEIGRRVRRKHYGGPPEAPKPPQEQPTEEEREFPRLMRETREAVDSLLASGRVEDAEHYMEQQRRFLAERGYYIRKLNQAYFAFYGSYADRPGFESPVGGDVKRLRAQSASIGEFAARMSALSSYADLRRMLGSLE